MSNQIVPFAEMPLEKLGSIFVKSGFFSDSRDEAQAIVKILAGKEMGFGPIASMMGVNIIKGRVSMSANLIASAIKKSGKYNFRVPTPENERHLRCKIVFYENGQECGTSLFTLEDAKRAGLAGDNWTKYPSNMLFARAISNGAKWYCADIFAGPVYTPDELGATIDGETGEVIEVHSAPAPVHIEEVEAVPALTHEEAMNMTDKNGRRFGDLEWDTLRDLHNKSVKITNPSPETQRKIEAINLLLVDAPEEIK